MDGQLQQLAIQIQKSPPQTTEHQAATTKLIDKLLRSCGILRCLPKPLTGVYLDIHQALQQQLHQEITQNLDKYQLQNIAVEAWIYEVRTSALQKVINEAYLQQLALEVQKHQLLTKQWQYAFEALTNAILLSNKLLHKAKIYDDVYEEAKNELWIWLYQNINSYNPSKGKFTAWLNFRFDMILRDSQVAKHDPFIQKSNSKIIREKYKLTNIIKNINREKLNFWLKLQTKQLLPYFLSVKISLILTMNFLISQLLIKNPAVGNSFLFEIVKQSLPNFTTTANIDNEIEKIPQVKPEKLLSEQLREYLETDPNNILQKHIRAHPEVTFQVIAIKRLEGVSWQELSETFNVKIPALSNFFQRHLQKIAPEIRKHIQESI